MRKRGNPTPWIKKAEQDYEAAVALSRKRKVPVHDVVCFHTQQCAEKYLKAFLVNHRVYFSKTHDLVQLLGLAVALEPSLALLKPFFVALNPYAVMFRYPDEHATSLEARKALRHLRYVREQLRRALKLSSGS
jgi:HEPN domain-containing protein